MLFLTSLALIVASIFGTFSADAPNGGIIGIVIGFGLFYWATVRHARNTNA